MKPLYVLLALLVISCAKPDPESQKQFLSGYWEIENVTLADGTEKTYNVNTDIDYISITGDSGTRKKMKPQLDGSFITNQAAEEFTLTIENKKLRLNYKTPYSSWQETILEAEDSVMVVENQDGTIYKYKKFRGFDLNL